MRVQTRFTQRFGIELPVVQGGLAYLARAELAAAVSNAGGLGQVTAATLGSHEALRQEMARVRSLTAQPFGVNFALGHWDPEPLLRVVVAEGAPVVSITGGNPEPVLQALPRAEAGGPRTLVLVSSVRQAQKAAALGADAVVAVGSEGGGHIGRDDTSTLVLVARILEEVDVPVLASGGIGNGRGLAAALALGADGVEMGTRFVATEECPAHPAYKQALLATDEHATMVIERTLGRPGRVLDSAWSRKVIEAEKAGLPQATLLEMVSGRRNVRAALEGQLDEGFVWAGQVTGLIHDVPSAGELVRRTVAEAQTHLRHASSSFGDS